MDHFEEAPLATKMKGESTDLAAVWLTSPILWSWYWGDCFVYLFVCLPLKKSQSTLLSKSRSQSCCEMRSSHGGNEKKKKVKRREWGGGGDEQQASVSMATVPSPTAANFLLSWGAERRAGTVALVWLQTPNKPSPNYQSNVDPWLPTDFPGVFAAIYCHLQAVRSFYLDLPITKIFSNFEGEKNIINVLLK